MDKFGSIILLIEVAESTLTRLIDCLWRHSSVMYGPDGRGSERVNVLAPYIAQLFNLLYDKACIPACWKQAKLSPLYRKGSLLDPNNYRMLAVSGTMYRMYANVIRSLLTEWCVATGP